MEPHLISWLVAYLLLLLSISIDAQSSFRIVANDDIEELVRTKFIKQGQCANVSNIVRIGSRANVGSFSGGDELLEMDSGIVFSTGYISDIAGRNVSTDKSGQLFTGSDQDLQRIATLNVQDATGIEFDFVPNVDVVTFDYVFASEEYCEYVDDIFNDVFGFFVSGPGISGPLNNGAINVAIVPETDDPVSINTVNHKRNQEFYNANLLELDARACSLPYDPNDLKPIEFDGYTVRLTAKINVLPCQTYRIRLLIGDVADDILDSAVFLAANSFDLGSAVDVFTCVGSTLGDRFYEQCLEAKFVFRKNTITRNGQSSIYHYVVEGTATAGEDYEMLSGSVEIPADQSSIEIPVQVIPDQIEEATETIILIVEFFSCDCIERDTAILYLEDGDLAFEAKSDTVKACRGQPVNISPLTEGGAGPYSHRWSTGDTTSILTLIPDSITEVQLTITDFCGHVDSSSFPIIFQKIPTAAIVNDPFYCNRSPSPVLVLGVEGEAPWSITYQHNGLIKTHRGLIHSEFHIPIPGSGTFEFLEFRDAQCIGIPPDPKSISERTIDYQVNQSNPSCTFAADGQASVQVLTAERHHDILWEGYTGFRENITDLLPGNYGFRIVDEDGCVVRDTAHLIPDRNADACRDAIYSQIYIPNAFSPNGDGINDRFRLYPRPTFIKSLSFSVFNRWGGKVHQSDIFEPAESARHSWNGNEQSGGAYVILTHLTLQDESEFELATDLTLIR